MITKENPMPKVKAREGELTIPVSDEVREKLDLHDGDELAAHVIEGSVIYTPTTSDARGRAWQRIDAITAQVRPTPTQARKPIAQVEEEIVDEVKRVRRSRRASRES
jgi:bifunctional DNA-binding transcriptional regulator/antitoxin component of YhaV-PrlF toxin-antitoxin module